MQEHTIAIGDILTDHLNLAVIVTKHITDGGMGEIYVCRDQHDNMLVLKTPRYDRDSDRTNQRFQQFAHEALTWLRLWPHMNIIGTYYLTLINDRPFLVLDYADGGSLKDVLSTSQPTLEQRLLWAQQILAGIVELHQADLVMDRQPIVHHDIKPQNILIRNNIARITDFGLTSLLTTSRASDTVPMNKAQISGTEQFNEVGFHPAGTPAYIAPELWEGAQASPAADMYAFGLVLSVLLAGRDAYSEATSHPQWSTIHRTAVPRSLCEANPHIPRAIDSLYHELLQKLPEKRLTAREAQRRLREATRDAQMAVYNVSQAIQPRLPEHVISRWVRLARTTARFREFHAAVEAIRYPLAMAPDNIDVIITQGLIAKGIRAYATASATLCHALDTCHEKSDQRNLLVVYSYLASLFSDTSEFREADYFYEQMKKQRNNLAVMWFNRAINAARWCKQLRQNGQTEDARKKLNDGLEFANTAKNLAPASPQVAHIFQYLLDAQRDGPPHNEEATVHIDDVIEFGSDVQYVLAEEGIAPLVTNMMSNPLGSYTVEHIISPIERIDFK